MITRARSGTDVRIDKDEKDIVETVLLVGDSKVGKTTLLNKYFKKDFNLETSTVMVDYCHRQTKVDGHNVKLSIFDTSGKHSNEGTVWCFMKREQTPILLMVFDLSKAKSFEELRDFWFVGAEKKCQELGIGLPLTVLIGNKKDLPRDPGLSPKVVEEFYTMKKILYMETSAFAESKDIDAIFDTLNKYAVRKHLQKNAMLTSTVDAIPALPSLRLTPLPSRTQPAEKSNCC